MSEEALLDIDRHNSATRVRRRSLAQAWPASVQIFVTLTLSAALFAEPFLRLVEVQESNGIAHVMFAEDIAKTHVLFPGHFLYHVLTVAVHEALPISWLQAHFVVVLGSRMSLSVVVWSLVRRSLRAGHSANDALISIGVSVALLFASAISFVTWPQGNYYLGYIVPNLTVLQTLVVLQPLALVTFFAVIRVLAPPLWGPSRRDVAVAALLAVLSTLAKPSYAMVLLPAMGVVLLARSQLISHVALSRGGVLKALSPWFRSQRRELTLFCAVVVPVLAAMAWVYISTYLKVHEVDVDQGSGVRIAPFEVMSFYERLFGYDANVAIWLLAKLLLSVLFPLLVAVAYFKRIHLDLRVQLAWLQFAFGLLYMYGLSERPRFDAGNFTWSAHIALFILFVVSTLVLIEQTLADDRSPWRRLFWSRATACYAVLLLHVIAGYGLFTHPTVN